MKKLLFIAVLCAMTHSCSCSFIGKNSAHEIGAITPSSSYLAKSITSQVVPNHPQKYILEVGAGTGVFTKKLIKKLGPHDHLDIIEIDPEFCALLKEDFGDNPSVTLYCGDVLKWHPPYKYDYVVSGLPFNSFTVDLVKNITEHYKKLSKPGTIVSFFEYSAIKALRYVTDWREERLASRAVIDSFIAQNEISREHVLLNFPPAIVYFLRFL